MRLFLLALLMAATPALAAIRVSVVLPAARAKQPLDGRLLLLLSTDPSAEPRLQITDGLDTQLAFGLDVENWQPGTTRTIDAKAYGYPVRSLAQLKPGEYHGQVLLHKYETFRRKDGHTVKLPMDRGEGQQWNTAPGNLHSKPAKLTIGANANLRLELTEEIPPIAPPKDTKYIRHLTIQSKKLTDFWGRPMHLGAHVLVPEGFDEHPEARYPLMIFHGHFPADFEGFRPEPPDPNLKPDYAKRFRLEGYNRIQQQEAHAFYQKWTSKEFPRFLIVEIQHANPYYDDSYAVNSANLGPYGDAIMEELLPEIERRFRGLGQGWARFTYGGSTGGWEALAVQVFYPDAFNGAFAACPDPVDFRAYTTIDLYGDTNAYAYEGKHKAIDRPGKRNWLGQLDATVREMNAFELVLGTKSRSGQQFDIWEAVYSPAGADGYPKRIFDKETGVIDKQVAAYWKEHYDLRHIMERDWATLGPKLAGKIHLYCGDMDNFYLNNAVYLAEEFLEKTKAPYYAGEVKYGDRAEHCWNGDPTQPNAISRLRYNTMYLDKILDRISKTAPPGADVKSWRY